MANLPTRNQNPGDLKDPATGVIRAFRNPQEGFAALKADLEGKKTGNTRTGLGPNSSLKDLAATWAPASDHNDPIAYADTLSKKLGVSTDAPIGSLNTDQLAAAIAGVEGYQGSAPSSSGGTGKLTADQFAQKIKSKYPQYQDMDSNTLTQKILAKYPQYQDMVDTPTANAASSDTPQGDSSQTDSSAAPYGYVKPPTFTPQPVPQDTSAAGGSDEGLLQKIIHGAGSVLSGAEKPFIGLAAVPTQLLAKAMGRPDPFAEGVPAGLPGAPTQTDVTPLDLEKKAGDAAQVGSYFIPGAEGVGAVAGAAGTGVLQGAGAAMSEGKDLPTVATQGALGGALGGGLALGANAVGAGIRALGDTLSGEGAQKALQGIKDAYASALNLHQNERAFEMRSGKDLAQVLMDHEAPLGRYENGTLDASGAIPKLQAALDPLNKRADAIVGEPSLSTKAANFISLDNVHSELVDAIKKSHMDSLEKEHSIAQAEKLLDATKREYGDVVSPQVGEKIKQVLQGTAFKKALTTPDALQKNVSYLASDVMRSNVEKAIGGTAGKEYKAINLQRSDLVDAITRLSKLDGVRLLKGGRLGNMAGGVVGAISGASSGLGPFGALAGDYFGTKAAEFMNNPATKIGAAKAKAALAGIPPSVGGAAGRAFGKGLSGVGNAVGKSARAVGLAGNLIAK